MSNKIYTNTNANLLNSENFISTLQFEAEYAISIKGGHLPSYLNELKRKRLVSEINLFSSSESLDLISNLFISKN